MNNEQSEIYLVITHPDHFTFLVIFLSFRPNVEQDNKSSSSSSSTSSSKIAGSNRNNGKETNPTLLQNSHEVKEVAVSRVSCHRCGNIRKNKLQCSRNMVKKK